MALLKLRFHGVDREAVEKTVEVRDLVIAGWAGRDREAVEKHIVELEALGVARPKTVPCFYRAGASLLTTDAEVDVVGGDASGEVEVVVFSLSDGLWVGVGSDHTDRKTEAFKVAISKQVCPKPVGAEVWRFADLREHWDRLVLRSYAVDVKGRRLYQEGPVSKLRRPEDLMERYAEGSGFTVQGSGAEAAMDPGLSTQSSLNPEPQTPNPLPTGTAMFCGTLPAIGHVAAAERFEMELEDPVLGRSIRHSYRVRELPLIG